VSADTPTAYLARLLRLAGTADALAADEMDRRAIDTLGDNIRRQVRGLRDATNESVAEVARLRAEVERLTEENARERAEVEAGATGRDRMRREFAATVKRLKALESSARRRSHEKSEVITRLTRERDELAERFAAAGLEADRLDDEQRFDPDSGHGACDGFGGEDAY
jgi:septal ring factor EnvC (AmiA/AmiB activator)